MNIFFQTTLFFSELAEKTKIYVEYFFVQNSILTGVTILHLPVFLSIFRKNGPKWAQGTHFWTSSGTIFGPKWSK